MQSSWARAALVRRQRCCWLGRDIGYSWSTAQPYPTDTVSAHILHPPGVRALAKWGLRDRLAATGCPPIHTYAYDFGAFTIAGAPGTRDAPVAYCPRRAILDKLLVDAAAQSGADIREDFAVEEV